MSTDSELLTQVKKVVKSKSKRQRKKQWRKCIRMCGMDRQGLINHARIAIVIRDDLTEEEVYRLTKYD